MIPWILHVFQFDVHLSPFISMDNQEYSIFVSEYLTAILICIQEDPTLIGSINKYSTNNFGEVQEIGILMVSNCKILNTRRYIKSVLSAGVDRCGKLWLYKFMYL
jgi:hypothetical protein